MNDDEIGDFVRLTAKKPWQVRFIELMPMGVCAAWPPERFLPAREVLSRVPELRPAGRSGVAQLYRLPGAAGTVGLIEPMSCAFCADCTRIRITADGKLKPCLHSDAELALRGLSGAELEAAIRRGILMKPARHRMVYESSDETPRNEPTFRLLADADCPAVLVEQCFLTNPQDAARLATPSGAKQAAKAYYEAICEWMEGR